MYTHPKSTMHDCTFCVC